MTCTATMWATRLCSCLPPCAATSSVRPLDITLRLLDSALYTAKREGRSRTGVVWMLCF